MNLILAAGHGLWDPGSFLDVVLSSGHGFRWKRGKAALLHEQPQAKPLMQSLVTTSAGLGWVEQLRDLRTFAASVAVLRNKPCL